MECVECSLRTRVTNSKEKVGYRAKYREYTNAAKRRGYDFELTMEEFKNLISQNCHYCDAPPSRFTPYKSSKHRNRRAVTINSSIVYVNGVDRKDNEPYYKVSNTVPCCRICNRGKNSMLYSEFLNYLDRIKNGK